MLAISFAMSDALHVFDFQMCLASQLPFQQFFLHCFLLMKAALPPRVWNDFMPWAVVDRDVSVWELELDGWRGSTTFSANGSGMKVMFQTPD